MHFNVSLFGGGSWGTTVASLIAHNVNCTLWARNPQTVEEINQQHTNQRYLPGATLPASLRATTDIQEALLDTDMVVMGIPSQNFRSVLEQIKPFIRPWVPIISLTKGLELSSGQRMSQVIESVLPGHPIGILTGPNLAREIIKGSAAASVIAMEDPIIVKAVQKIFLSGLFRVYTNHDLVGCEIAGVLKNVIAIAAGMGDGMGAGDNTRSALLTRGLAEITRLGVAMGGEAATFSGLAGMGDLLATCTSPQSRNRTVGYRLGKGEKLDDIINDMHMVAEGVKSIEAVHHLAEQHGIFMPIAEEVYQVIKHDRSPRRAFRGLIRVDVGAESQAEQPRHSTLN